MKKVLKSFIYCYLSCCFSLAVGENPRILESHSSVRVIPIVGLQFQENDNAAPYSFYYPYDYGYYYPDTYEGFASSGEEECYSRLENGIFFYYCD
ncbi:hypothetical protein BOKEGFJH_00497 [Chlamydia avium]|uniref:Lipoprotein n=2 Tax=Chlamydia avium TaxID=1457141 RepID=W8JGQ0_9CHLA|nr:hypothetical protein [Chlamydia avium]AHK63370.1 Putative lipoprotein [Chlamydia avium 10DC88]EPP37570.1 putative lipoprotein [Chlamydia psittaci 10_743_SC13]EPP38313.1 putative lipoprotein [Chlamydia avium]VVT42971.1 hypothetical protein BOKEGFJH_00497 [Chlamydia avium]